LPPDAPVLGFDTSAAHCAAGLFLAGRIAAKRAAPMQKGQAEHLFPMLEELLADQGLTWRDLAAIGVGIGPGNFTGIRIAVSAARGLALSLGVPAIGVSSFDVLARGQGDGPLLLSLPAPRDQLYLQRHEKGAAAGAPEVMGEMLPPELGDLSGHRIIGHDAARLATLTGSAPPALERAVTPDTLGLLIAEIAADRRAQPCPRPAPLYVRPADAAPMRDAAPAILP